MHQPNKTTRFFAATLVVGGGLGVALVGIAGFQLVRQSFLLAIPMFALVALFAWAAFTGVRLWQGTAFGRKWAPIQFAAQIPVLIVPGATYQWFTGAEFGPALRFGDGIEQIIFTLNFGASGQFFLGTDTSTFTLGVNLFAVIALWLLLRSNKQPKSSEG